MAPKQRGVHVSLRNVSLAIPKGEEEREMLRSDLFGIGCAGLLERPWNLKNEEFIRQFVMIREQKMERSNIFDTTIRDPESESEVRLIARPEPNRVVAPVNQVKRGNQFKHTYQAPEGSPPTRSRGKGSQSNSGGARPDNPRPMSPPLERPRPEHPKPQQPEPLQPEPEGTPWVLKPFDSVVQSYKMVKKQYQAIEKLINSISWYLDVEPDDMLDRIKARPTPQDVLDLQARMDYLLKENGELRRKVDEGDVIRKENRELKD